MQAFHFYWFGSTVRGVRRGRFVRTGLLPKVMPAGPCVYLVVKWSHGIGDGLCRKVPEGWFELEASIAPWRWKTLFRQRVLCSPSVVTVPVFLSHVVGVWLIPLPHQIDKVIRSTIGLDPTIEVKVSEVDPMA
jgi:hypothetical protein